MISAAIITVCLLVLTEFLVGVIDKSTIREEQSIPNDVVGFYEVINRTPAESATEDSGEKQLIGIVNKMITISGKVLLPIEQSYVAIAYSVDTKKASARTNYYDPPPGKPTLSRMRGGHSSDRTI